MAQGMTIVGWIFMAVTWSAVIALTAFCFRRVLLKQSAKNK